MQSESINEIATALAKAQGEMKIAVKDADNPFFKSKYADLGSVVSAARPALAAHGLSVIHTSYISDNQVIMVCTLLHSSGQWISAEYPIKPVKDDPQGLGSAYTYGKRYTYGGITGVVAGDEDDDGNAASEPVKKESLAGRNRRFEAIKWELANAQTEIGLKDIWTLHNKAINEFKAAENGGQDMYDTLVKAKNDRKTELMQKQQLGE